MKQRKKEIRQKSEGSLAFRVLLITLVCLVFPLLALASLLYLEESRIKMDNNVLTLKILMQQKQAVLVEIIEQSLGFLQNVSFLLTKIDSSDLTPILEEMARRDGFFAFFHIQKEKGGGFYSDKASSEVFLKKDYSELAAYAKDETPFVVDPDHLVFYLTYLEPNQEEGWVIGVSLDHLLKNFSIDSELIHPVSISIVSKKGRILFSTNPEFKESFFPFQIGERYEYQGVKYTTLSRRVEMTNFSFVMTSPATIHFVDFPSFVFKILWILTGMVFVGGGIAFLLIKKLSKPLKELIVAMEEIERGNLSRRFKEKKMGFEINQIGRIFNETVDALQVHMEAVQKERIDKETYEKELKIGQDVQCSILPKSVPQFPGVEMAARFLPAKEVGGDFYDFLVKNRLMVSIADTSGKGISACLYSLSIRSLLRGYAEVYQDLDWIIKETNALFCRDTGETGVFVTAFLSFFDPKTRVFEYSNCGHLPALRFKKDGTVEKLTTKGMAFGVSVFDAVEIGQTTLESGDLLILFTDGIIEAHNAQFVQFQEKRLITSIREKQEWQPEQIVESVLEEVVFFAEGAPQFDDLSIVAMKIL